MKTEAAPPLHIRLLGAPGTGKTQLAAALRTALSGAQHAAPTFTLEDNPAQLFHSRNASALVTLLMGLDLPAPPACAGVQQTADRALRDVLAQSGISYQVVYGQGEQRLRSALAAIQGAEIPTGVQDSRAQWIWACDNCSDPQCERRLLSKLLTARGATP
ncbi:MAG: hypothetical protein M3Q12_14905 [Pseudomonadota bacterium]|uniref:hypothetical protein n=1 Tax=Polaromonas sp. TaxID=1869339 RepID=UPI001831A88E|nr:hypothetical protein [Polaromonas sp.]MBA3594824.1 hypothetical protein [Polaromonas sp.]MDQ3273431.1 hypothetical protein [Pseudomonadota bacterium]